MSNSSILIALSTIGQLSLLNHRFPDGILVPQAVWREVVETGNRPGAQEVASALWVTVYEVTNKPLISLLRLELDEGEAEAIALSCEQPAETILLDEKNARRIAQRLSLVVLGTVGILIWAKRAGLIPNLKEQLDALQSQGKFRLSKLVYQQALDVVGEQE